MVKNGDIYSCRRRFHLSLIFEYAPTLQTMYHLIVPFLDQIPLSYQESPELRTFTSPTHILRRSRASYRDNLIFLNSRQILATKC